MAPEAEEAALLDLELGSEVTLVAIVPGSSPVWFPDSARIVHLKESKTQVRILSLATGGADAVCELPRGREGYEGLVSAGGSAVLASNGDTLYLIDLDRGSMERLTTVPSQPYRDAIRAGWFLYWTSPPVFDAQSRLIAFAASRSPRASLIEVIDLKGTTILTLTNASEPTWIEGGKAIVFTRTSTPEAGPPSYSLRHCRLADGAQTFLFPGSEPTASPDGSRLCYFGEGDLRVWSLADATTQPMTIKGCLLAWSPDGKNLLVMAYSDSALYSIDPATGHRVFLMKHPGVQGQSGLVPGRFPGCRGAYGGNGRPSTQVNTRLRWRGRGTTRKPFRGVGVCVAGPPRGAVGGRAKHPAPRSLPHPCGLDVNHPVLAAA